MAEGGYLKLAVRRAIKAGGGIEAVAEALVLSTSTIGRWNNLNDTTLPCPEQRVALDELAMACGGRAEILTAQALHLGHVAICLPRVTGEACAVQMQMLHAADEFGDVAGRLVEALRDGVIDAREADEVAEEIKGALAALVRLNALLPGQEAAMSAVRAAPDGAGSAA